MPFVMHRHSDGTYRVHHRPVQGKENARMIDGPVFMGEKSVNGEMDRRLYYLARKAGGWVVEMCNYITGMAYPYRNVYGKVDYYAEREAAEKQLRALASVYGWRDLGDHPGTPDFVD